MGQRRYQQIISNHTKDDVTSQNAAFAIAEAVKWEIWCKMDFNSYPLDTQVILLKII